MLQTAGLSSDRNPAQTWTLWTVMFMIFIYSYVLSIERGCCIGTGETVKCLIPPLTRVAANLFHLILTKTNCNLEAGKKIALMIREKFKIMKTFNVLFQLI